ncbi:MAG: Mrp/NBP35 family ATP-binding protein, partial [Candidatus Delongbacteria bacterium]
DADIYGPSITKMFGTGTKDIKVIDQKIEPVIAHGVHTISIGNLVDPDSATIWRGPLIHKALTQMLTDVNWGELDYLIVDLPPGTGDVQISLAQLMKITGFIAVSTPQEMSLADVVKAADMFKKVDVPLLGIVENMSYFICDSCNKKHFIFGKSKVSSYADKVNAGFFYQIPIEKSIMDSGESGEPYAIKDENDIYGELSSKLEKTVDKK